MTPEQEVQAYEDATQAQVTDDFAASMAAASATIIGAWVAASLVTGIVPREILALIARVYGQISPSMRQALADRVDRGIAIGARQAHRITGTTGEPPSAAQDVSLTRVVDHIDTRASMRVQQAVKLSRVLDITSRPNVLLVTSTAHRAVTTAQADTAWAANRAVSEGQAAGALAAGMDLIWMAERDACLHCLAHAGLVVHPGNLFPAGISFDPEGSKLPAVPYPPLHPHCRCRIRVFNPDDMVFAESLRREAERSVARGFSNYASRPRRVAAAGAVVATSNRLPKTVLARAARDVRLGSFSGRHNQLVPQVAPGRSGEVPARIRRRPKP